MSEIEVDGRTWRITNGTAEVRTDETGQTEVLVTCDPGKVASIGETALLRVGQVRRAPYTKRHMQVLFIAGERACVAPVKAIEDTSWDDAARIERWSLVSDAVSVAEHVLGMLVDAVGDDFSFEIGNGVTGEGTKEAILAALDVLGPEYQRYRDSWWLL